MNDAELMAEIIRRLDEMQIRLNTIQAQISNTIIAATAMGCGKSFLDIKREFLKTYPRATGFLADVQYGNLHLLKFLQQIAYQHGITFWLHAGTLIGAVRHGGFIPWDDDADIAMMRADFEHLCHVVTMRDDCTIEKYYNDITCSVSYQFRIKNLPLFIDIAVWDWTDAPSVESRTEFLSEFHRARTEMQAEFRDKLGAPKPADIGLHHLGPYAPEMQVKVDNLMQRYADALQPRQDYGNAIYLGLENYPFPYPVMAADDMFDLTYAKFEDGAFLVPKNIPAYLAGYGDIFSAPPDMGQTPHLYAFEPHRKIIEQFVAKRKNNE